MKTIVFLLALLLGSPILPAQNLFKESFDYPAGDSLDNYGGWSSAKVIKSKVKIVSPGLSFNGYAASGVGNAVKFSNIDASDLCTKQLVKVDSGNIYLSFLLKVDSLTATATTGYNIAMDQYGGTTNVNLRCYVQRATDSTFKIGVSKYTAIVYIGKTFKTKKTHLVVLKHTFVPGTNNDTSKIYVFSDAMPEGEPSKADTVAVAGNDPADIGEIWLSNAFIQSGLKGSPVTIDEIRVGRSWNSTVHEPVNTFLTEDFMFAAGDTLRGKNGWDVYYDGTPLSVDSAGLSYAGYHGSGLGKSLRIVGGAGSQTLYRSFYSAADSVVYLSFMVNVSGVQAAQGFFVSLTNTPPGNYRAPVYVKIDSGKVQFGLRTTLAGSTIFDTTKYQTGTTYLLVVKYQYIAGANNDEISLFVLAGGIPPAEPNRASVGPLIMPNDNITVLAVAINSGAFLAGGPLQGAIIRVDGIRIAKQQWKNGLTGAEQHRNVSAPSSFRLEQNYPNPFNPSTTISYAVPADGVVSLKVYDMLGREVAVLVNGYQHRGEYSVPFTAGALSSGVYFYRMESGSFFSMKKMILLK